VRKNSAQKGGFSGPTTRASHGSSATSTRQTARGESGPSERISDRSNAMRRNPVFSKPQGLGLRSKFMLVMSGITVVAMTVLGLSMANTTNQFLFSQKQHSGIDIARLAAQLGVSVLEGMQRELAVIDADIRDNIGNFTNEDRKQAVKDAEDRLLKYLQNACRWGETGVSYSDVLAVRFSGTEISDFGWGEKEKAGAQKTDVRFGQLFIPKIGRSVNLPPHIEVYEAKRVVESSTIPIYRFKIALEGIKGGPADVRVDIAAQSVHSVRNHLYLIIMVVVAAGIGLVILVANWLAGNITKPLDMLLTDMQVVARGNLMHQTRAHSKDEIGVLAHEFNRMTQNLNVAQSALVEQEKADYELSLAREVQRQLLPAEAPKLAGYDCAAFYHGAKAVSGDYFDIIPLGNGLWGFIVADVSGKGIPGSMLMAVMRTIVRLVANKHQERAAETLKETNRLIAKQIKRGMFVTAFYAILDEANFTLTYASAGHNPMIIYRAASKSAALATTKGIAIGFNDGPIFDKTIHEGKITLQPNDAILLYTDGFPEAMNAANEEYGEDKFYKTVAHFGSLDSRALIGSLVNAIAQHRGQAEQSDDLTIITVRRI
jgi:serine phosphatase RsbU (regulator of sigma subunit)